MSAIRAKPITAGNDLLDLFMTRIQNDELDVFHNRTYFMHDVIALNRSSLRIGRN